MSEPEYYYSIANGAQHGPLPESALLALVASGKLSDLVLVWTDGMPDWTVLKDVPGLATAAISAPATTLGGPAWPAQAPNPPVKPVRKSVALVAATKPVAAAQPSLTAPIPPALIIIGPSSQTPSTVGPAGSGTAADARWWVVLLLSGMIAVVVSLGLFYRPQPQPLPVAPPASLRLSPIVPDHYASIQAALNAAQPGEVVQVRPGSYLESLILPENARLEGEDRATVFVEAPAGSPALSAQNLTHASVANITFRQAGNSPGVSPVVSIKQCGPKVLLEHCAVVEGISHGIELDDSSNALINCNINKNAGAGIFVSGGSPTVKGNETNANKVGIALTSASMATLTGNHALMNVSDGIAISGAGTKPQILQNECSRNLGSGIVLRSGATGTINGNTCEANTGNGIELDVLGTNPTVTNNLCRNNGWQNIVELNTPGGTVADNIVDNAPTPPPAPSVRPLPPNGPQDVGQRSPLGDILVTRSRGDDDKSEIWLECIDNSRRSELLCAHDPRTGEVSFSPDERWIVVTDGGGPGSSRGTEIRCFRRDVQNLYKEVTDAELAETATRAALRAKGVPDTVALGHVYAMVNGWSADGQRLKLSVWGHGPGYPGDTGDGHLGATEVEVNMPTRPAAHHGLQVSAVDPGNEALPQNPGSDANAYSRYANRRYSYSVVLPTMLAANLREEPSAESASATTSDGRTKLLLRVKRGEGRLDSLYKQWSAEHTSRDPGKVVDYKSLHQDWFVVSGFDGPRGYYVKVVVRGNEALFLCLEYDQEGSNLTEEMLTKMSRSFTGHLDSSNDIERAPEQSRTPFPTAADRKLEPQSDNRQALARAREADRQMTEVYTEIRRRLAPSAKDRLKKMQLDWLQSRTAQTGSEELLAKGPSANSDALRRFAEMDEARTAALRGLLNSL